MTITQAELTKKRCVPCRGGVPPMPPEEVERYMPGVPGWAHENHRKLRRAFVFDDFAGALAFVNAFGEIAEAEGHHPDLLLSWGLVDATVFTHKISGLTEADFILCAKANEAWGRSQ